MVAAGQGTSLLVTGNAPDMHEEGYWEVEKASKQTNNSNLFL